MPKARCRECGSLVSWPGGLGRRMVDYSCHLCGGALKGLGGNKGDSGRRCVVCKASKFDADCTGLVEAPLAGTVFRNGRSVEVALHDPICWHGHGLF